MWGDVGRCGDASPPPPPPPRPDGCCCRHRRPSASSSSSLSCHRTRKLSGNRSRSAATAAVRAFLPPGVRERRRRSRARSEALRRASLQHGRRKSEGRRRRCRAHTHTHTAPRRRVRAVASARPKKTVRLAARRLGGAHLGEAHLRSPHISSDLPTSRRSPSRRGASRRGGQRWARRPVGAGAPAGEVFGWDRGVGGGELRRQRRRSGGCVGGERLFADGATATPPHGADLALDAWEVASSARGDMAVAWRWRGGGVADARRGGEM